MERERHGRERGRSPVAFLLALLVIALPVACNRTAPQTEVTGWTLDAHPVPDGVPVVLPDSVKDLTVTLVLPEGYELAEGYSRHLTISGPSAEEEIVISAPGTPTAVAVPEGEDLTLTLSIGFCSIQAKEICYVSVTDLVLHRSDATDATQAVALTYRPEVPD